MNIRELALFQRCADGVLRVIVYLDESGDTGMKGRPGSSEHFVIAGVAFSEEHEAKRCRASICALKRQLGWRANREFKFNSCSREQREAFMRCIVAHNFKYAAMVMNKAKLIGPGFQFKESFYKYTAQLLFSNIHDHLDDATVIFDRCGDRAFRKTMHSYLKRKTRKEDGRSPIKHVTAVDSKHDELVQMADMVVGAIARWHKREKQDCDMYRSLIRTKEIDVNFWPK